MNSPRALMREKDHPAVNTEPLFVAPSSNVKPPVSHFRWSARRLARTDDNTRVLVVDDYEVGAEALAAALSADGYETRFALSGIEAVRCLEAWQPDVIVLDINMPEYNGFETARVMRGLNHSRECAIIAFTALSAFNVIDKAQACGFDAYCQKGTSLENLISLIDAFVA